MADLLTGWQGIVARLALYGLLCLAIAAGGAWQMHRWDSSRYEVLQGQFTNFKVETKAAADVQNARSAAQAKSDQDAKGKADEKYRTDVAALTAERDRLQHLAARGSIVPPTPAGSRRPDLACFDRAKFGNAVDDFVTDVSGQVASGASATLILDGLKGWAADIQRK